MNNSNQRDITSRHYKILQLVTVKNQYIWVALLHKSHQYTRTFGNKAVLSVLTIIWQLILLCLSLHALAPSLHPLHLSLQQAEEKLSVSETWWSSARVRQAARTFMPTCNCSVSVCVRQSSKLQTTWLSRVGALVVVSICPLTLCVHSGAKFWLRFWGVALEGTAKLQPLVLRWHTQNPKTLHLQISLHTCCHTVGAFESCSSAKKSQA